MKTIGILSLILAAWSSPRAWAVSAGNYLLASDWANDQIVRFDATTGTFVDVFVPSGLGSLDNPEDLAIGPNGDDPCLYKVTGSTPCRPTYPS